MTAKRIERRFVVHARRLLGVAFCSVVVVTLCGERASAVQEDDNLAEQQRQLTERYRRFEEVLMRLAEVTAESDPKRAALMRKAAARSKERLIGVQLERLVELMESRQFANALRNQGEVRDELLELLELLLEENRDALLESQRERYRRYLKALDRVIQRQEAVQGQTDRGADPDGVAGRQSELAEQTGGLAKTMRDDRAAESEAAKSRGGAEDQGGETDGGEGGASPEDGGESAPSEAPGAEGQPGAEGDPGESSGEGQGSDPQGTGAQEGAVERQLQAAERRMRAAEERLREAEHKEASEEQAEALAELHEAKRELERILRQMREEEIQRKLAQLETRFRKMLKEERAIAERTEVLDAIAVEERGRSEAIEAGKLAEQQTKVVLQADAVLALLEDDGTAVAMPEAVLQMRGDMQQVAERLSRGDVGRVTQAIEQDVLEVLGEILAALEKAQKDAAAGAGQGGESGGGNGDDEPLVATLAELKLIRSLQKRVNRRTELFTEEVEEGEQVASQEALEALVELSERQERIEKATRDIVTGRNR